MNVDLTYQGRSGAGPEGVGLATNTARGDVGFDGELRDPVSFREAMGALRAVVISDLRPPKNDRTAWLEYKAAEKRDEDEMKARLMTAAAARTEPRPTLQEEFQAANQIYLAAFGKWRTWLWWNDRDLWRSTVPYDPVITVAEDMVFFEAFSADASSYAAVYLDRSALAGEPTGFGTTNVDYSANLAMQLDTLRSYRRSKLSVDPGGFAVETGAGAHREEKIDLPVPWLHGFAQLQAARTIHRIKLDIPADGVVAILDHLSRRREKTGPRALRFRPSGDVVLEPWDLVIPTRGRWDGPPDEIRIWGRRRLAALARVLPIADRVEVHLIGTGLPSTWIVHCGAIRFVFSMSGWTASDWSTTRLDLLVPRTKEQLEEFALCRRGQAIIDPDGKLRLRSALPVALTDTLLGPEPPEVAEGFKLWREKKVAVTADAAGIRGRRGITASVDATACEAVFDPDGGLRDARCRCSWHYRFGIKRGPCRHLLALRLHVFPPVSP